MMFDKYEAVIGLEVHAQLKTNSKAFSPDSAAFGALPNVHVDMISLAHPGTLPVLNKRHVEYAIRMGLATNCAIASHSVIARKHYFYPDLPKGYQISQYEEPLCEHGFIEFDVEDKGEHYRKHVGITRIHIEEDAGKLVHDQDPFASLVDVNRCGTPLIEIVSEPDLRSAREVATYMQTMWEMVRWLGICDGNMEEGSLRCDANISIRLRGETKLGTKTELKNMNSFRNIEKAVEFEIMRQMKAVEAGEKIIQQTRLWDTVKLETRAMRTKEQAHDYRYFPDPDLPPVWVSQELLEGIRAELPELPEVRRKRFVQTLGLPTLDARVLTEDRATADYFEAVLENVQLNSPSKDQNDMQKHAKMVSNFVMGDVLRILNEQGNNIEAFPIQAERLAGLVTLRLADKISSTGAQQIFAALLESQDAAETIAQNQNLLQVSDSGALIPIIKKVIANNPKEVQSFLGGKSQLVGFFIGQVMRNFTGSPDPKLVRQLMMEQLEALRI